MSGTPRHGHRRKPNHSPRVRPSYFNHQECILPRRRQQKARRPKTPTDIQAILTVIARRTHSPHREGEYRLDLHNTNLRSADLREAHLEGAHLARRIWRGRASSGAHLEGAHLIEAHLEGAHLAGRIWRAPSRAHLEERPFGAHLEEAHLDGAHLEGAHLLGAHLEGAHLFGAHLEGAHLFGAHLEGANLFGAHLEGADLARRIWRGRLPLHNLLPFAPCRVRALTVTWRKRSGAKPHISCSAPLNTRDITAL